MAEGLLRQVLLEANKTDCNVSSAGLGALVGHKADPSACQLMMARGIDISGHRACQLHADMIRKTDLILVMELSHKHAIIDKQQSARGKVFRLGEWEDFDIADPYKKDLAAFERSLILIEKGISQWMEKL
jgi:low molecular weight protein-tyrosine phosphatase